MMNKLIRRWQQMPWKQAFFSAVLVGNPKPAVRAEAWPFFPLSTPDNAAVPIIQRQRSLDARDIQLVAGASRLGDDLELSRGGRVLILQKAQEELRVGVSPELLQWAERNGSLSLSWDSPFEDAGSTRIPAADRDRWIEITAQKATRLPIHALRYEEVGARLEDELRPISLPATEVTLMRSDGREESFFHSPSEIVLPFKQPTLLKIQSRVALPWLKPGQRALCLVRYQRGKDTAQYVQSSSAASPYESGKVRGEAIGVGSASSFYLLVPWAETLTLASDCLLQVQSLALDASARLLDASHDPHLFAAWNKARMKPLETYVQLAKIPRENEHARAFQALQRDVGANELYFKALYPKDLAAEEEIEQVRGILRREYLEALPNPALIPTAQQADCICIRSSAQRQQLSFLNPTEGQESLARLVIPERPGSSPLSFQIVLKNQAGKILRTHDARVESLIESANPLLAAVSFPLPADTHTIAIVRSGNTDRLPDLGLDVLTEREAGLDQATLLQQLQKPEPGVLDFLLTGEGKNLSAELRHRLLPARLSLQRQAAYLETLAVSPVSLHAEALKEARLAMMREGSFQTLRNICLSSIKRKVTTRREAFTCLRDVFQKTEDYRSLAVTLGWQYQRTPRDTGLMEYAAALKQAGLEGEALMVLAEFSGRSASIREALQSQLAQQDSSSLMQADARPLVRRFPESLALLDSVSQQKLPAFALEKNERIVLDSASHDWDVYELEWRTRAGHDKVSPLHWVEVTRGRESQLVPLLFEGRTSEMKDPDQGELSAASRFFIAVKKGQPLEVQGRGERLYLRIKHGPEDMSAEQFKALVSLFPRDPQDAAFLAAFSKMGRLEEAGRLEESMTLRAARIAAIRQKKTLSWPDRQRLRILEQGLRWVPLAGEVNAAQLLREEFTGWSPDHPALLAQKALLPKLDAEVITMVSSEEEDFTELELVQDAALRLQLQFLTLDESGLLPQDLELQVDDGPWQAFTMEQRESTRPLKLAAGLHRLGFRFKEKGGPRYLAVKIAAQLDDAWVQLKLNKVKYWAVATPEEPIVLRAAGLYRIHRRLRNRTELRYVALKKGEVLTLSARDDAAWRFYALVPDRDQRPRRERRIQFASLIREPAEPDFAIPEAMRPVYSVNDAPAWSLALGTRSNCRDTGDGKQGFCDDLWHPRLALTLSQSQESSQILGRLAVFPGRLPLGQLTAGWEQTSLSRLLSYEIQAHAFFADHAGESLQGGSGHIGASYQLALGSVDSETAVKLNVWEANRRRIHPDLPQEAVSQWKADHRRTLGLGQYFEYKAGLADRLRLQVAATSNPPGEWDEAQMWDQGSVLASWLRAWTAVISTGLGYEARYYFRDAKRRDYLLRYSPRFSLVGLNYDALQWPILTRLQVGLEPDSPRTVFSLTFETPLGTQLNPDAASLRTFPFSDQGRGEIFKRHVQ